MAFRQDQAVTRYETFDELLGYCRNSANPVGHLVLYLCGYRDEERQQLSDFTCTALQLANFWQDVSVDWKKGRVYLPLEDLRRFGVSEAQIAEGCFNSQFRELDALRGGAGASVVRARTSLGEDGEPLACAGSRTVQPGRVGDSSGDRKAGFQRIGATPQFKPLP